jgi:hypothetical protein
MIYIPCYLLYIIQYFNNLSIIYLFDKNIMNNHLLKLAKD